MFMIVRAGVDTYCVGRTAGSYPIRSLVVGVGTRRPLGVGAAGLAVMASLSDREQEQALVVNAPRLKQFSGLSAEQVRSLVQATRQQKFSLIDAINVQGLKAVGVAVPDVNGMPAVGLSVGGITARVSGGREKFLADVLHEGAAALGAMLRRSSAT